MRRITTLISTTDETAFFFINHTLKSGYYDWLMPKITRLGGVASSIFLSLSLLLDRDHFWHETGVHLATSLLISNLIVNITKKIVRRPRPYQALANVSTGPFKLKDGSFPSGHTTASFCTATALTMALPAYSLLFYSIAILIAFSRVYLGLHYPSDITIGAILGTITAMLTA